MTRKKSGVVKAWVFHEGSTGMYKAIYHWGDGPMPQRAPDGYKDYHGVWKQVQIRELPTKRGKRG